MTKREIDWTETFHHATFYLYLPVSHYQALQELFLGIKVVITGDEIRNGERNLLIMNHRTRLDWMYLWSVLVRQSGVKTEKIILKAPVKYVPGAGMPVTTFFRETHDVFSYLCVSVTVIWNTNISEANHLWPLRFMQRTTVECRRGKS